MHSPKVSVIMPLYNSSKADESINSVIMQSYKNWELIITDDCSNFESFEGLKNKYSPDKRIKFFRLSENSGPAVARNNSIKKSKGEFIAFLDSDDIWLPNKLKVQLKIMLENEYSFSYTAFLRISETGNKISEMLPMQSIVDYTRLLKTCDIGCSTVMLNRSYFKDVFMPNIAKRQDYALWLKLLKTSEFAYGIDMVLTHYRIMGDSVSSNKLKAAVYQFRVYYYIERLGVFRSLFYMLYYTYFGIKKTYF
jgi:teichuronic acid biosynthesis glycosyltransferase TuaG